MLRRKEDMKEWQKEALACEPIEAVKEPVKKEVIAEVKKVEVAQEEPKKVEKKAPPKKKAPVKKTKPMEKMEVK